MNTYKSHHDKKDKDKLTINHFIYEFYGNRNICSIETEFVFYYSMRKKLLNGYKLKINLVILGLINTNRMNCFKN